MRGKIKEKEEVLKENRNSMAENKQTEEINEELE